MYTIKIIQIAKVYRFLSSIQSLFLVSIQSLPEPFSPHCFESHPLWKHGVTATSLCLLSILIFLHTTENWKDIFSEVKRFNLLIFNLLLTYLSYLRRNQVSDLPSAKYEKSTWDSTIFSEDSGRWSVYLLKIILFCSCLAKVLPEQITYLAQKWGKVLSTKVTVA